jgi:hypothetical protein
VYSVECVPSFDASFYFTCVCVCVCVCVMHFLIVVLPSDKDYLLIVIQNPSAAEEK